MSVWDEIEGQKSSGGKFLRLADGERATVVFCGDPVARQVVWTGSKTENYDPNKHADEPKTRYAINIWNVGEDTMQILEMSGQVAKQLNVARTKYAKKHGGLEKCMFEITREGSGTDTRYNILFDEKFNGQIKDEQHDIKSALGIGGSDLF